MKKLFKSIMGLASVAAVAAGAYYFTKKWMDERDEELEDDFDDLDFDDEEDDEESREYVTLDLENGADAEKDSVGEDAQESEPTDSGMGAGSSAPAVAVQSENNIPGTAASAYGNTAGQGMTASAYGDTAGQGMATTAHGDAAAQEMTTAAYGDTAGQGMSATGNMENSL